MSHENVERTRRAYRAINERDLATYLEFMDADVEAVPRVVTIEGSYRGHDGMRRWWNHLIDFLPDIAIEVAEVRDLGDRTLATVRMRGRGASSDAPLDVPLWTVVEWRDGKCVRWANYGTQAEALAAVGLSE
jgi:ketosteroid isomerase-like protein